MDASPSALSSILDLAIARRTDLHTTRTIPDKATIQNALEALPDTLPVTGLGTEKAIQYVRAKIIPGFAAGHAGPRYFGFVTGGTLPAAEAGDFLTTIYDANCMNNLPDQSITAALEDRTLEMVLDLLNLPRQRFELRTLTTGATASNVLGLACGRDYAVRTALGDSTYSVAEHGFGGVAVRVLCDRPHASTVKAAGIVGIGRANVIDLCKADGSGIDLERLQKCLKEKSKKLGVMVVLSCGEVNTGEFTQNIAEVRELCDKYDAWLHIDAAFGAFARAVPDLAFMANNLELADSITSDAHKWLNVPYDCGLFFSRSAVLQQSICGPSTSSTLPAYLAPPAPPADQTPELAAARAIPSALNIGIENSRRCRALPLFCSLVAMGKAGYSELFRRNVEFARRVGEWMHVGEGSRWYKVLNVDMGLVPGKVDLNVVLFCAKESCGVPDYEGPRGGAKLIKAINETGKMYVSPGAGGALRLAVSDWMTGLNEDQAGDFDVVVEVLQGVMQVS